jgi:hypothetical protein
MSPLKAFFAVIALSLIAGGTTVAVTAQETLPAKFSSERLMQIEGMIAGDA